MRFACGLNRRLASVGIIILFCFLVLLLTSLVGGSESPTVRIAQSASLLRPAGGWGLGKSTSDDAALKVGEGTLKGKPVAAKLSNETAKADLGRATWKFFHTTLAGFPETPSDDEKTALLSFIHLFARLYPCGECAIHFQSILTKFPPQVSSRSAAAGWGCHVHNQVNMSLEKETFDCSKIGDFYDCGCADDEHGTLGEDANNNESQHSDDAMDISSGQPLANTPPLPRPRMGFHGMGTKNRYGNDEDEPVELVKEDFQRGGR